MEVGGTKELGDCWMEDERLKVRLRMWEDEKHNYIYSSPKGLHQKSQDRVDSFYSILLPGIRMKSQVRNLQEISWYGKKTFMPSGQIHSKGFEYSCTY